MTPGLFRAAIMSSSTAQNDYVINDSAPQRSIELAAALGAGPLELADPQRRVNFLRNATVQDINTRVFIFTLLEVRLADSTI